MPIGRVASHTIIELFECPRDLLDDPEHVEQALRDAVDAAGVSMLREVVHRFQPQGVTAIAVLSESHLSIHTWPEHGYLAADIFTCGTRADPEKACTLLVERFKSARHELQRIDRGPEIELGRPVL